MPRILDASLTAAFASGVFTPWFRLQLMDSDRVSLVSETTDVISYELDGLKAEVSFHDPSYDQSWYTFRLQRGLLIAGTPVYVSSSTFWPDHDRHEKRIRTVRGHIFPHNYFSTPGDVTYHEIIDTVCANFGVGVQFADPAAAWLDYQFLPDGRTLVLNDACYFFTYLRQKYLIFATDGDDNNILFYQAVAAMPAAHTHIQAKHLAAPGNGAFKEKRLLSRDEVSTVHYSGGATHPLHNLGYLESTDSHPDRTFFIDTTDWVLQGVPPDLANRDFDRYDISFDVVSQTIWPAKVREVFNKNLSPSWQWQIRNLDVFGITEGGAVPSTIEAASPYTPLNVSNFNNILDETDNNLQAAMETLDDHDHDAWYAALASPNVFTAQQFIDGSSDQVQFRVQGHSTQTSNLQTWENSAAGVLANVDGLGDLTLSHNSPLIYLNDTAGGSKINIYIKNDAANFYIYDVTNSKNIWRYAAASQQIITDASFCANTATNTVPFYITRLGSTTEAITFGVDDSDAYITTIQDENSAGTYGSIRFRLGSQASQNPNFIISDFRSGSEIEVFHIDVDTGNIVINETGLSTADFRLETDIYDAVFVDASNDSIVLMSNSLGKIGVFGAAAVARQTALTAQLTTLTYTAPGTPDYAIQDFTQTNPWGFTSHDEANSVLKVIANLQVRCAELETKLKAYGWLP
jgi:hypothetical protein